MINKNVIYILKKIPIKSVFIKKMVSINDFRFVKSIKLSDDYNLYIRNDAEVKLSKKNDHIIYYNDRRIGLLETNFKKNGDTLISNPNIYFTERYNYSTVTAIMKVLVYLFDTKKCEKVEVIIYGNNKGMIKLMENSGFRYEGKLKKEIIINDVVEDLIFYSMLESEYSYYKKELIKEND